MTSERTGVRSVFVYVHLPGQRDAVTCGRHSREVLPTGEVIGRFTYGRTYRTRPDAVALDPFELPLVEGTAETVAREAIFGALADAGPDAWGRRVIDKRSVELVRDPLDYLLLGPQDRFGALQFGLGATPPPPVRPVNRTITLDELREAARAIEAGDAAPAPAAAALMLTDDSSLLGGMRPKAGMVHDGIHWVAKFPARGDRWSNAPVEAAMLRLAATCGLRVPEARVERLAGGEQVLLVERFDREAVDGGWCRARAVSALTVLRADDGGTDRRAWSYLRLADELGRWVGDRAARDREELFRRMVFNACISNTDDHPKNHALIAPRTAWQLAPAYDLTPSPSQSVERDLAMECGPLGRRAMRANLLAAAPRFGLDAATAAGITDTIASRVRATWAATVRAAGGTDADCTAIASAFVPAGFEFEG